MSPVRERTSIGESTKEKGMAHIEQKNARRSSDLPMKRSVKTKTEETERNTKMRKRRSGRQPTEKEHGVRRENTMSGEKNINGGTRRTKEIKGGSKKCGATKQRGHLRPEVKSNGARRLAERPVTCSRTTRPRSRASLRL